MEGNRLRLASEPGFVLGRMLLTRAFLTRPQKTGVYRMGMSVGVLDHFNIRTRKLADTVRFYEDILGLEKGARPDFAFPGPGCTARARLWCIWSIFRRPRSRKSPIPA